MKFSWPALTRKKRDWIASTAIERFQIDTEGERYQWLTGFVDLLLEDQFVR
jgi:hypothetical protein